MEARSLRGRKYPYCKSATAFHFSVFLLRSAHYAPQKNRKLSSNQSQILFKALETTATADGGQIIQAVEMLLQRDEDAWRLKQLRILPADEARHDGLV